MSNIMYNNVHVDASYKNIFEPNLFFDSWLIPGVTYNDQYEEGEEGGIFVHKIQKGNAVTPGNPGRDFEHEELEDELIAMVLNTNYQKSTKIYGVQVAGVSAPLADSKLSQTTKMIREAICGSALASLVKEGTAGTVVVPTKDNVEDIVVDVRTELTKKRAGSAKVILAHPDFYGMVTKSAGKAFTPAINDRIVGNGEVGNWHGFTFFNVGQLGAGETYKYKDYASVWQTVTGEDFDKINFIALNPMTFHLLINLKAFGLVDARPHFTGVYAQGETNCGFRVSNNELVYISRKSA